MLANLLAIIIGIGSLAFYLAAFILPEVHRRSDFFWSGVGMFYAVVLWYCSGQMGGAVLLGQTASVGLLLWLGYQTLLLRRAATPAVQQTPIWLGKSGSPNRITASRPIANDYEFVEDGVEDAIDREPDPDSPILIKPAADEFGLKMVVPAAMPNPTLGEETLEEPIAAALPPTPNTVKKPKKPNPIAAVGIVIGWLKDVATPKKKAPKPMIELPPRPPSIPKPDVAPEIEAKPDTLANTVSADRQGSSVTSENSSENGAIPQAQEISDSPEPAVIDTAPDIRPTSPASIGQDDDEEETNWPEDEFWD